MTTSEIMELLGITDAYDTSKPQPWMDEMCQKGFDYEDLRLNYVWLYDEKAKISGRPFNCMAAYARYLDAKELKGAPPEVFKAVQHVREFFPDVCIAAFSEDGTWCYMTECFDKPSFEGVHINLCILEDAVDSVNIRPAIYQF